MNGPKCLALVCALTALGPVAAHVAPDATIDAAPTVAAGPPALPAKEQVLETLDRLYQAKSSHGIFTMKVVTKHYTREMTMEVWSRGKDDALIVIRKPAREAGVATLKTKDGLWDYAPRADRLIRVPPGLLSESWMGSHFTNDDLIHETRYTDDYRASLAWGHDPGDAKTRRLVVTLVPKATAPVVWSQVIFYLRAGDWLPLRCDYYGTHAAKTTIARTMWFSDIKDMSGRKIPTVITLIPSNKPHEYTRVTYEKMAFDIPVDSELFTPRGIRRAAQQR